MEPPSFIKGKTAALLLIGNIGDLLLLEPCLRFLSAQGLVLDLYCTLETAMVWTGDPRIRQIVPIRSSNSRYQNGPAQPLKLPRVQRYDYLFDFWPTARSAKLTLRLWARERYTWPGLGKKRLLRAVLYNHRVAFPGLDIRRDRVYLALLGLTGNAADAWLPARMTASAQELEELRRRNPIFCGARDRLTLIMQPTARWTRKLWPVECWRELVQSVSKRSDCRILLISGPAPEEQEMLEAIAGEAIPPTQIFPGTLEWQEVRCALASADAFVGLDSAPAHLAAMLAKPVIVLFGPTNEKEWGPVLPGQRVIKAPLVDGQHLTANIPVEAVREAVNTCLDRLKGSARVGNSLFGGGRR